jgi:hypothetical protein
MRRRLQLPDLNAAVAQAETLAAVGYDRAGLWDLAQVCGHLADWLRYPVEGFPTAPLPLRPVVWLLRTTMGRRWRDGGDGRPFASAPLLGIPKADPCRRYGLGEFMPGGLRPPVGWRGRQTVRIRTPHPAFGHPLPQGAGGKPPVGQ